VLQVQKHDCAAIHSTLGEAGWSGQALAGVRNRAIAAVQMCKARWLHSSASQKYGACAEVVVAAQAHVYDSMGKAQEGISTWG
jgi:hypothetical protein